jgi:hypothetical protein
MVASNNHSTQHELKMMLERLDDRRMHYEVGASPSGRGLAQIQQPLRSPKHSVLALDDDYDNDETWAGVLEFCPAIQVGYVYSLRFIKYIR